MTGLDQGIVFKYQQPVLLERLIQHAQSLGANAIIGVRFDSSDVGGGDQGLTEILAYGSAVVVQPT